MPHPAPDVDTPSLHEPGNLHFESDRLPWQRSLRWTEPPRDRRLLWAGLSLAILVTVLELAGFALGMRPYRMHRLQASNPQVVQVILIEPPPDIPVPPEPEPPIVARPSRIRIAPPQVRTTPPPPHAVDDSDAMRARIGEAGAPPAPKLFNPDGSIRLGDAAPKLPQAPANPQEAAKARWAEIRYAGENPLDCKKTRFAQNFAPDESVGSGIARKYLSWVGLYDPHDTEKRARRAAEGCDPPK